MIQLSSGLEHQLITLLEHGKRTPKHEQIKQKLKGSGFEFMFEIGCKISHMKSLLLALVHTYKISIGVFCFDQNELYFGLEDVLMIIGLRIDGKPIIF